MRAELPSILRERYASERVLGAGGFGVVILARDRELERRVAIKLLHKAGRMTETAEARFLRESRILAQLEHPGVVELLDAGRTPEGPYMITEYLEGEALPVGLPAEDAWRHMRQVGAALEAVHAAELLHRDLKPANIIVTPERTVLIDFGLVSGPEQTMITRTGMAVGTVRYMAPEVLVGKLARPESDWYAWGATYFHALTGEAPRSQREVVSAASTGDWPPIEVPEEFQGHPAMELCLAYLEPDPARRRRGLPEEAPLPRPGVPARQAEPTPQPTPESVPAARPAPADPTPSSTETRARLSRRRWALSVAAIALLGVGLLAVAQRPVRPAPPTATSSAPAPTTTREPPGELWTRDLRARVVAELQRATVTWVTPEGRIGEYGVEPPPEGAAPLVQKDPATWPRLLRHLPELNRIGAWIVEGGRPETLPPKARADLQDIDEAFRAQALGAPFAAQSIGPETPGPWPEEARARLENVLTPEQVADLPDLLPGWLRAGVRRLDEEFSFFEQLYRDVKVGRGPVLQEIEPPAHPAPRIGEIPLETSPRALVRFLLADGPRRAASFPRMARPRGLTREGIYALARSVRDEPRTRETAALVLLNRAPAISLWGFGMDHWPCGEPLLGARPRTPAGHALQAVFLGGLQIAWHSRRFPADATARLDASLVLGLEHDDTPLAVARVGNLLTARTAQLHRLPDRDAALRQGRMLMARLLEIHQRLSRYISWFTALQIAEFLEDDMTPAEGRALTFLIHRDPAKIPADLRDRHARVEERLADSLSSGG